MPQREFPSAPLVGVGAVIVDPQGRVLLIKRATEPMQGRWSIPGGLVELGETLLQAIRREVEEETGLLIEPQAVVEVVDRIYTREARVRYHYVIVDYWCRVLEGTAFPASDAADVAWAERSDWDLSRNAYDLEPVTIQVIEKAWHMAQLAGTHG